MPSSTAIKGGGSQINVMGSIPWLKTISIPLWIYPPGNPPPTAPNDANGWNQAFSLGLIFAGTVCVLVSPRSERASPGARGHSESKEPSCSGRNPLHLSPVSPYGDFMIGPGNITYRQGQTDNSIFYDSVVGWITTRSNIEFPMIDFQYQLWDLGKPLLSPRDFYPGSREFTSTPSLSPILSASVSHPVKVSLAALKFFPCLNLFAWGGLHRGRKNPAFHTRSEAAESTSCV